MIFCGTQQIIDIRMSIKMFETHFTTYVLYSPQWWKTKCWMKLYSNVPNSKIWLDEPGNVNEKFNWEQTSFNIVQHNFYLPFSFFINFVSSQMHPTFRPTSKIYDVGWNVGCICVGLKICSLLTLHGVK